MTNTNVYKTCFLKNLKPEIMMRHGLLIWARFLCRSSYFIKDLLKSVKALVVSGCVANGLSTLVILEEKKKNYCLYTHHKSDQWGYDFMKYHFLLNDYYILKAIMGYRHLIGNLANMFIWGNIFSVHLHDTVFI